MHSGGRKVGLEVRVRGDAGREEMWKTEVEEAAMGQEKQQEPRTS